MQVKNSEPYMDLGEHILSQVPGYFYIKNLTSNFLFANQQTLKLFGFASLNEFKGSTDYDLKCDAKKFAKQFIAEDQRVIQTKNPLTIFYALKLADENIYHYLVTKSPLYDNRANLIGIICHGTCIEMYKTYKSSYTNSSNEHLGCYYQQEDIQTKISLTKTQQIYLFYILRGKTAKEISRILKVSIRTSQAHFENLKVRFDCQQKSELIDKAIRLGFLRLMPWEYLATFNSF